MKSRRVERAINRRMIMAVTLLSLLGSLALFGTGRRAAAKYVAAAPMATVTRMEPTVASPNACVTDPVVENNANSGAGSLRQAIADACDSSTITFADTVVSPITLSNELRIDRKSLTIQGPGTRPMVISGNHTVRVFETRAELSNQVTFSNLTIADGFSGDVSGIGVYANGTYGTVNIINCTISGNNGGDGSPLHGGGVSNYGTMNIINSTISGNHADDSGGGIFNNATLYLTNCTISGNSTRSSGGGIVNNGGTINVKNTIIAGNTAPGPGPDVRFAFNSLGYNLIGNSDGSTGFTVGMNHDQVGFSAAPLDPQLGPLQDNGGPTFTMALLAGSPAIDQGKNFNGLADDQRGAGFARTFDVPAIANAAGGDGTDIGAFEFSCATIMLAALPGGVVGTPYSQTITASPVGGNYTLTLTSGLLPAGLTLNSNGSFSGAPIQSGVFNFRVTATGFGSCTGFRDYTLIVNCASVTLNPASLPGGTASAAYNQSVSASPAGTYNYSVTSGALPLGLSLNASTGAIAGTPSQSGSFAFTLTATAGSCSGSRGYTINIGCQTITLPATVPGATAGANYSQSVAASPAGSYTYSLLTGSLPSGLTLNTSTGAITGVPSVTGTYNFSIKAQTANGCSATQQLSLAVNCPTISLSALSSPTLNLAYSQIVTALPSGGSYSFAVTAGSLPTGLSLNSASGAISGTPTVAGAYSFTVSATGFGTCTGNRTYSGTISGGSCPAITLPDLPGGAPGQMYSQSVGASPSSSYSYAVTSGSLPSGLTLFGSFGLIYGYPATAGTYNFTITATGTNNCTGERAYTLTIGTAASRPTVTAVNDFDGDGKSDVAVWRGMTSEWLIVRSSDGETQAVKWGASYAPYRDVAVPADYDGDGKADVAVFRRGNGHWYIKQSSDGQDRDVLWGLGTDVPVPGDYDGDGKADIAVWRGSEGNWYIRRSSDDQVETIFWGAASAPYFDVPVPADYDGDGKTDIAVYRASTGDWYIRQSSDGKVVTRNLGLGSDLPVPADYDGDGKADIAVWRSTDTHWQILLSGYSAEGAERIVFWGTSSLGDVPVLGDYDGDGKADIAVWRSGEGNWYVKLSHDDSVMTKAYGQRGDTPVSAKQP